jgi:hypothetical protein
VVDIESCGLYGEAATADVLEAIGSRHPQHCESEALSALDRR